jgi:two-component system, NtrC family, nitrogen regulation sensor histidine kinase NtrY
MKIRNHFIILFVSFVIISSVGISLLAIKYIKQAFLLFTTSENFGYTLVLGDRLYLKVIISFISLAVIFIIASIPFGLYLFKHISEPYLNILKEFSKLASSRFDLSQSTELDKQEQKMLESYYNVLKADYEKLKEFDKVSAWKDGARMLLHEIKNPLTPLKLTTEQLLLNSNENIEEVKTMHLAIIDMETVLKAFRELVSINFKPKEKIELSQFLNETISLISHKNIPINISIPKETLYIDSEASLLRMVISNLINNGLEANSEKFNINIEYKDNILTTSFITPDVHLENIDAIFQLGVSNKSEDRGFGLFITKRILDYLDHELTVEQKNDKLVFNIKIKTL